jgi:hypothetical protein
MRRFAVAGLMLLVVVGATAALGARSGPQPAGAKERFGLNRMQQRLLSGTASTFLDKTAAAKQRRGAAKRAAETPASATGCPVNHGADVRVNQECQNLSDPDLPGRGQAQNETSMAQDPFHPSRLIGSANDYRRGDGNCYGYLSTNGGRAWKDTTIPMSFTRGTNFGADRQYWTAGGDTSVDFDTKGNAYLSCQVFNRGTPTSANPDLSSAFYVFRASASSIARGGASWTFPGRPVAEHNLVSGEGGALLDKQLMTVDNHKGSPFQDRVYVTWTFFDEDGTAYIYAAHSSDYAESFSKPVLVSRASPLCTQDFDIPTPHGSCNENQFSQPFTGPDGALYVAWANFNNDTAHAPGDEGGDGEGDAAGAQAAEPEDNHNQMLLAKSTDGGVTFSKPVKVSDYYELPDCETYQGQDAGRSCVPEKGSSSNSFFRATNYPVGAVNPRNAKQVVVTLGSYINRHSNEGNGCVPTGINPDTGINLYDGVKAVGACNNDIVVSTSRNAGRTFTGGATDVRKLPATRPRDQRADQFWQWADFDPAGHLAASYYDRGYGHDETTGYSDVSVSGSRNAVTFATARATTSSMPPPTQFAGLFFGDYSGLAVGARVHPFWMDTRDPEIFSCRNASGEVTLPPSVCTGPATNASRANDQNVYTRGLIRRRP